MGHQSHPLPQWSGRAGAYPYTDTPGDVVSVAGSMFDEVTPSFPCDGEEEPDAGNEQHGAVPDPHLQPYPSQEECTTATAGDSRPPLPCGLPRIVVLPLPEDDDGNPFLSPSYSPVTPPHCVGVQDAGISHVNGVYLLAKPQGTDETAGAPPLYFRDGPPVLLSDGRCYDMCILRIDCPDSDAHVIWFLARVDVDPACLDVRFSDCYYYCRLRWNETGRSGASADGSTDGGTLCQSPPARGWNVPKLPPGVETLWITPPPVTDAGSGSAPDSAAKGRTYGMGIETPQQGGGDGDVVDFMSPGVDSGVSKYSI